MGRLETKVAMMGGIIGAAGLKRMVTYTDWANGAILDATAALDQEQLTRDLRSSFPSIRDTLLHIAESDWIWLRRWNGESPAGPPDWVAATHNEVRARWAAVMSERKAFLAPIDDAGMLRRVSYRRLDGSEHESALWELLLHLVNHATYHRGQITTMLRQLGARTVSTDMTRWYREHAVELAP